MDIQQEKRDGVTIVAIAGRIDSVTSNTLDKALTQLLDRGETRVVVDMGGVEFISSAGLRVAAGKGRVVLCSLSDSVRQIFRFAGFLSMFTIAPSSALALETAKASG